MRRFKNTIRVTSLTIVVAASACSGKGGGDKSQVVARVNGAEITVSQLRTALLAKGEGQPTPQTTQQSLDGLVNEQLLVDAALANKLDRDPTVVQALEAARRQLLARAYMERTVFPKQEISAVEQAAYYKGNSALFAHRRVYQLAAFTTPMPQVPAAVVADLAKATTPDAIAEVLGAHQIAFETQNLTRAAEQLPLEQLPQFAAAGTGDVVITQQRGRSTLTLITGVQDAPLGFESAQPIIQQYLENLRNAKALDSHLKQVRASATISQSDPGLVAAASVPAPAPEARVQQSALDHGAAVLN
ncbi:MAG: EpsD family peptidyl-prolyl cis-trans isomerase [Gammaproteobacteria bacterium]